MKNKMVPAIMCLAFTAQTVNFSAAANGGGSSSDYERYYDRARKKEAEIKSKRERKARKNSKFGFFSFMQGKTFEKVDSIEMHKLGTTVSI